MSSAGLLIFPEIAEGMGDVEERLTEQDVKALLLLREKGLLKSSSVERLLSCDLQEARCVLDYLTNIGALRQEKLRQVYIWKINRPDMRLITDDGEVRF